MTRLRFAILGSGSRGNALVVEAGRTRLLLDDGFPLKELSARLARLGLAPDQLSAVLISHEHNDHIGGVGPLARRHRLPVWLTPGTYRQAVNRLGELPDPRPFNCHEPFTIGDLQLHPYPIPHDAREPCQFVFDDGARRLGVLTDAGSVTPHMADHLAGCDALIVECNHDPGMLANGPYPPRLQRRVGGPLGHLANHQGARLVEQVQGERLQHLVAAHLSEKNNTPELARAALAAVVGGTGDDIDLADQERGLEWREIA